MLEDIKEDEGFKSCLANDKSTAIYLHSNPGTGKGTFGSTVFRTQQRLNSGLVTYYSFSGRDMQRTKTTSLLGSLIYQILSSDPSSFAKVQGLYSAIQERNLWTSHALWILLRSLLASQKSTSLLCIINGIHNWASYGGSFLPQLMRDIRSNSLPTTTRLVLIGELREELSNLLPSFPTTSLAGRAFPLGFAQKYAKQLITQLVEEKQFLAGFRDSLEKQLGSCDNLIQLSLTMEILSRGRRSGIISSKTGTKTDGNQNDLSDKPTSSLPLVTVEDVSVGAGHGVPLFTTNSFRAELELLPYDIPSLVTATFWSLPDWARRSLSWILHSQRSLIPRELAAALALREHEETIRLDQNEQFLDISEDLKKTFGPLLGVHVHGVSLRHEQVKASFLQVVRGVQSDSSASTRLQCLSHWDITRMLLKYLVSEEFQKQAKQVLSDGRWVTPQQPFFEIAEYAVLFWPAHYREARKEASHAMELLQLLPAGDSFGMWHQIYCQLGGKYLRQEVRTWDPLFLAAQLGLTDVVDACLTDRPIQDKTEAVSYASWSGHLEIVKRLVESDETKKAPTQLCLGFLLNAVTASSNRGFKDIVTYILDYLAEVNAVFDWDPILLCQAAEIGYLSLVKLFVEKGAAVDATLDGNAPLQLASKNGHEGIVKYLLSEKADANSILAYDLCKPILHAASKGYTAVAKLLLNDADLRLQDGEGRTALHLAARNGHQEIVSLLMKRSPDPPELAARDNNGRTALHLASQHGHNGIAKTLADAWKKGIDAKDNDGCTPLRLASQAGHSKIVDILLVRSAKVDETATDTHTALYSAVIRGYKTITERILHHADRDTRFVDIESVLREAAKRGFLEVCRLCIANMSGGRLDAPDENGRTALHYAASSGHEDIVELLVKGGSDVDLEDAENRTPLALAALASMWKSVKALLSARPRVDNPKDRQNQDLLRELAKLSDVPDGLMEDHVKTIRALLEAKIGPNGAAGPYRETALHHAARQGKVGVIRDLLDAGADPMATSSYHYTPIFHAVLSNSREAVELLLPLCGGALIQKAIDGWTPLHTAAYYGRVKVMEVFVKADLRALEFRTADGRTPLILAYDEEAAMRWLLDHGANVDAQGNDGMTTLMKAAAYGYFSTVKLLVSRGANIRLGDKSNKTALHYAVLPSRRYLGPSIASYLLNEDPSLANCQDDRGRSVLHIAVDLPSDVLGVLLEPIPSKQQFRVNADLQNNDGNTPLLLAVMAQKRESVRRLLEFGVDTEIRNKLGNTALLTAIKDRSEGIWKQLLNEKNGANVNAGDGHYPTALPFLAFDGDLETLTKLVEDHKADVKARGGLYGTPLQAAVAGGWDETVRYLLSKGADPAQTGGLFGHALSAAVFSGLPQYVTEFLGQEAVVVDHQDDQGRTAMHIAAMRGDWDLLQILTRAGGSMAQTDRQSRSVIHHAAMRGNTDVLEKLLQDPETAVLNAADAHGWLPLHWACRSEANSEAVALLARDKGDSWAQTGTPFGWTPENIAIFHEAPELVAAEKQTRKWKVGDCHWDCLCDGCQQEVRRLSSRQLDVLT